jgi:hypothetical protein
VGMPQVGRGRDLAQEAVRAEGRRQFGGTP